LKWDHVAKNELARLPAARPGAVRVLEEDLVAVDREAQLPQRGLVVALA
jgi:hypothetical protein